MVSAPDSESEVPEFNSRRQVVRGSTSRLRLYVANWCAFCKLGFLTCSVIVLYSVPVCMAANYQPTHPISSYSYSYSYSYYYQ